MVNSGHSHFYLLPLADPVLLAMTAILSICCHQEISLNFCAELTKYEVPYLWGIHQYMDLTKINYFSLNCLSKSLFLTRVQHPSPLILRCLFHLDRESGSMAVKKLLGIFFNLNQCSIVHTHIESPVFAWTFEFLSVISYHALFTLPVRPQAT